LDFNMLPRLNMCHSQIQEQKDRRKLWRRIHKVKEEDRANTHLLKVHFKMCQACLSMRSRCSYKSRKESHMLFFNSWVIHELKRVSLKTKTKRLQNQKIKQLEILLNLRFQLPHLLLKSLWHHSHRLPLQERSISFHIFSKFKQ